MSKFFDWIMTDGDWEQTNRIQLYKRLGKKLDEMSAEELKVALKKLEK